MSHDTDNPLREPQHEWLDLQGLTRYAAVSERTLRAWIHSPVNPLPAVRVRGKILVNRRAFDAWLRRHAVRPFEEIDVDAIVSDVLGKAI